MKLVRTITFLSFQIGQLYLVCGCMTIRRCVAYRNDLRETLTSKSNNWVFLNSIFLSGSLRGDISFRYLKQLFLVLVKLANFPTVGLYFKVSLDRFHYIFDY